jgi:hypothetical protein
MYEPTLGWVESNDVSARRSPVTRRRRHPDLAVGAPGEGVDGTAHTGAVFLYRGWHRPRCVEADRRLDRAGDRDGGDESGFALAAADLMATASRSRDRCKGARSATRAVRGGTCVLWARRRAVDPNADTDRSDEFHQQPGETGDRVRREARSRRSGDGTPDPRSAHRTRASTASRWAMSTRSRRDQGGRSTTARAEGAGPVFGNAEFGKDLRSPTLTTTARTISRSRRTAPTRHRASTSSTRPRADTRSRRRRCRRPVRPRARSGPRSPSVTSTARATARRTTRSASSSSARRARARRWRRAGSTSSTRWSTPTAA